MAKKSKTLKQKKASEKRLVDTKKSDMTPAAFNYTYQETSGKTMLPSSMQTRDTYTHITHDLRKTLIITSFIVLLQLTLYYFMYLS